MIFLFSYKVNILFNYFFKIRWYQKVHKEKWHPPSYPSSIAILLPRNNGCWHLLVTVCFQILLENWCSRFWHPDHLLLELECSLFLPPNPEFKKKEQFFQKKLHPWTQTFPFWLFSGSTAFSLFHFWQTYAHSPRTRWTCHDGWEFLGVRF